MKKVLRNSVVLVASLLVAFIAKATVIGGGTGTASSSGNLSVLGCGDSNPTLKRVDCKRTTPVYACSTDGTGEVCVEAQSCPSN